MILHRCDACGLTINHALNTVDVKIHLFEENPLAGYVDKNLDSVSGRSERLDLCNRCYNRAMKAMVDEFQKIQGEQDTCDG